MRGEQDFQQLLDLVEGQLAPDVATQLRARLAAEDETVLQADFAWLQQFVALRQSVTLPAPPAAVREQLMAAFRQRAQAKKPASRSLWQRLESVLSFDSWAGSGGLALAGMRSADLNRSRQLVYSTNLADISLDLLARNETHVLNGQVLPLVEMADDFVAQLVQNDTEIDIATPDELGEFSFSAVPSGSCQLILSSGQVEIITSFTV